MQDEHALPDPTIKLLVLYLIWLAVISAGLLLFVSGVIPERALSPEQVHLLLVESQVFFLVIVWPLFLSRSDELFHASEGASNHDEDQLQWVRFLLHAVALMLFSLPLVVLTANISETTLLQMLQYQTMVTAIIVGTGIIWYLVGQNNNLWLQFYFPFLILFGIGAPVLYGILLQTQQYEASWLLALSPFSAPVWEGSVVGANAWLFQSILFVVGGLLISGLVILFQKLSLFHFEPDRHFERQ